MSLAKALLAFQSDAPALQRDSLNPHFKHKFISLENLMGQVMPVANKHGLVISQFPTVVEGRPALRTRITHADSGEHVEDVMLLQAEKEGPQAQGSALTYARRYSLMAALGLVADEDDDANGASSSGAALPATAHVASDNPAEEAHQAYLAAAERAQAPDAIPSEQVIHFGKNKGLRLGDLNPRQLAWYASEWKLQDEPSEYDHRLKAAAVALNAGHDTAEDLAITETYPILDDSIPF